MLGWPKRCKLAHAFLWEYSCKRLKWAQLLGQLGVFLARMGRGAMAGPCAAHRPVSWPSGSSIAATTASPKILRPEQGRP